MGGLRLCLLTSFPKTFGLYFFVLLKYHSMLVLVVSYHQVILIQKKVSNSSIDSCL
jgi:hypothetical protein